MYLPSERIINEMCGHGIGQRFILKSNKENIDSLLKLYFSNLPKNHVKVVAIAITNFDVHSEVYIDYGAGPTTMLLESSKMTHKFIDDALNHKIRFQDDFGDDII